MSHIKISVYYVATGYSTSRYPYITMQKDVPYQDIHILRCNRISHIKISVNYDATGCPTSRYLHDNVPHQDIRILQRKRISHTQTSVYYNATEYPTSRYPNITMQQNVPHQDIRILRCNRMSHIKMHKDVPHHDDYFPFLQRPLHQLNGRTPNCRRCKPPTPPTQSFASPSLPNNTVSAAAAL